MTKTKEQLKARLEVLQKIEREICKEIKETRAELDRIIFIEDRKMRLELEDILMITLEECNERLIAANKSTSKIKIILLEA